MKYTAALFLCLAVALPGSFGQENPEAAGSANLSVFMQRSEQSQAALIENSNLMLLRLNSLEKSLLMNGRAAAAGPGSAPAADISALEMRVRDFEARLAANPTPGAAAGGTVPAAGPDGLGKIQLNLNMVWIVVTGALVFFMQAGFCMLELGLTRSKNAINICMKNFLDFCVGAICFLFIGCGIMFGFSKAGWIGTGPFWLSSIPLDSTFWAFWFFQLVFCGTAATIISGAMAERTKFIGYLLYTAAMTALIYPIAGHWAWGSFGQAFGYAEGGAKGWLEAMGYIDFAGSSVVHGIGGAAALAGIMVVGPRLGRFRPDGSANFLTGHNIPLAALGTFILWFGWYGFNPGSTLLGDPSIGRIAVNTTIAPAAGALAGMFAMWLSQGKPDIGMTLNGALGGLVGITANCHCVSPASAVAIGVVAGIIATFGCLLLERLHLDDAVGAVPVHLFCGWWGILAVALFHEKGFDPRQLGVQALGVASITGFSFVCAFLVFYLINKTIGLRAEDREQDLGLDFTEHSGAAYPEFATGEQIAHK